MIQVLDFVFVDGSNYTVCELFLEASNLLNDLLLFCVVVECDRSSRVAVCMML